MHSSLQVENGGTNFLQENAWLLGNGYIRGAAPLCVRDISYFTLIPAKFTAAWIKGANSSLQASSLAFPRFFFCFHELERVSRKPLIASWLDETFSIIPVGLRGRDRSFAGRTFFWGRDYFWLNFCKFVYVYVNIFDSLFFSQQFRSGKCKKFKD